MLFQQGTKDVNLAQIHFLWPKEADLLQTHSDVIFSDSLWQVSMDNDFLLTMVVIDKNNRLKLAASSLSIVESKDSWMNFYGWVKTKVPELSPRCLTTDGVSYIYQAFVEATGIRPVEVHCLWHLIQNKTKQYGTLKYLTQLLVHMSYSQSPQDLQEIHQEFFRRYRKLSPQRQARMIQAANNHLNTAFINLKVFTGKTLTNSYAESVNAQLRGVGMNQQGSRVEQIKHLQEFTIQSLGKLDDKPFVVTPELVQLLGQTTLSILSNGVVDSFKDLIKGTRSTCKIISNHQQKTVVQDTVQCTVNGIELERTNEWTVEWDKIPKCSCNGLVYGGMPCKHLICVALHEHNHIPLQCFNKCYWVRDPDSRPEHLVLDPDHNSPEQPQMDLDLPTPPEGSTKELQDQIHMTWSSLMSKFNDPNSCKMIATMQRIIYQILKSHHYTPHEMDGLVSRITQEVNHTIREVNKNHLQQVGVLPQAQAPVTASSFCTVPQMVQRDLNHALQTAPVVTQPSIQP